MKNISRWARHHIIASRLIIVASWVVLILTGIYTGNQLHELQISIPVPAALFFCILFAGAFLFYPGRYKRKPVKPSSFYIHQKRCDFILALSSFCMIVYCSNHSGPFQVNNVLHASSLPATLYPKDSIGTGYQPIRAFAASLKDANGNPLKWKERKQLLKAQVRAIKQAPEPAKGEKVVLIILSVLLAVALLSLVAALACSIACSGSGLLAALVLAGGTTLIVLLLITMIKSITGKKIKKRKPALE